MVTTLESLVAAVRPADSEAIAAAWRRQHQLTKPRGSLGALEQLASRLAGAAGRCPPPVPTSPGVAVFAGDHGVHAQGVTPWPQEVTAQMVAGLLEGTAVVNSLARRVGARVVVVDVGVAGDLPARLTDHPDLLSRRVRRGAADLSVGPAMTREQAVEALLVGAQVARDLVGDGHDLLVAGDMGIANTTPTAALVCAFTGASAEAATGRGTGVDDDGLARKVRVVRRGLDLHAPDPGDPVGVLAAVGGLEHAAVAGFLLQAAALRVPVVLDGAIAGASALAAHALAPAAVDHWVAGHRSTEPGASLALDALGLRPLLELGLRLGEGSGAVLAIPLVQSACAVLGEVATFGSGVAEVVGQAADPVTDAAATVPR